MTAREIVAKLKEYSGLDSQPICSLHKECFPKAVCGLYQTTEAINFDKIKDIYCQNKGIGSISSADGIADINGKLVFVEIKGWIEFINRKKKLTVQKMEKQADKYSGIKKYIDSLLICSDIAGVDEVAKYYVLVTDIDTKVAPLEKFKWNMSRLAGDATKPHTLCNLLMEEKLKTNFSSLDVKYRYVFCRNIDNELANL